jgi:TIR domain/NACHT domain
MSEARRFLFISYRSLEAEFALRLGADLRNAGIRIWMDRLDGIRSGEDWRRSIERAIDACSGMVAILSPAYLAATYCRNELARADDRRLPVVPVLLHELPDGKPIELQRIQHVDFTNWMDEAIYKARFEVLMRVLAEHAQGHFGERPDAEHQYLTTLLARLQANRGVELYVDLLGGIFEQVERQESMRPSPRVADAWGLGPEFRISAATSPANESARRRFTAPQAVRQVRQVSDSHLRLAILGEPGAGKTTTLRRLALDAARERLKKPHGAPFPLYIELPQWTSEATPEDLVRAHWPLVDDPQMALRTGDAALYLDGLNEMGATGAKKAEKLREWIHDDLRGPMRVIVTCRQDDYVGGFDLNLPVVVAEPLDATRIRQIARNFLEDDAQSFLARVFEQGENGGLANLAANPYLLTAMMVIHRSSEELPRNKGSLFLALSTYLWNRERLRSTPGWRPYAEAEPRFAQLAFAMIDEGMPIDIPSDVAVEHLGNHELVTLGVSASLLRTSGERIRFYHQLIQESFAAAELQRRGAWDRIRPPWFSGSSFFHSRPTGRDAGKWDEVAIAACGIASADADTIVRRIAARDPYLALMCIEAGAVPTSRSLLAILLSLGEQIRRFAAEIDHLGSEMKRYGFYPMNRGYDESEARRDVMIEVVDLTHEAINRTGTRLITRLADEREGLEGLNEEVARELKGALALTESPKVRAALAQALDSLSRPAT